MLGFEIKVALMPNTGEKVLIFFSIHQSFAGFNPSHVIAHGDDQNKNSRIIPKSKCCESRKNA